MNSTLKKLFAPVLLSIVLLVLGGGAVLASTPAPSCNQDPSIQGCLYFPSAHYTIAPLITHTVTYSDIAGAVRSVPIAIRVPVSAPTPLPVVIWSHGGASGHINPANTLSEWSETTAGAGYLTISIAHVPRNKNERWSLCQAIATLPGGRWQLDDQQTCEYFKYLNWDRPHDIRAVLDELAPMNAHGKFQGLIDLDHIAVGGHSSGSSGALTVGGALRNFTGSPVDLSDPRPVAFLALSPQQPGTEGFFDMDYQQPIHSWMPITRPVLIGTGDGDSTCSPTEIPGSCYGETPYGRRIAFERMSPGDKYLIYFHDTDTFHQLFALETQNAKCGTGVQQQKCDEVAHTLQSVALAFLDGYLRQNALALQWLGGNDVEIATDGVAEWSSK
jgi:predicted dienelactone hydrolase